MGEWLETVDERTKVRVRVRMSDRRGAAESLGLPAVPLTVAGDDPAMLWLAPDQWLLVSDTCGATGVISIVEASLSHVVFSAIDVSAALRCYRLTHSRAHRLLETGSGIDFESLRVGQCARTRFAQIPLIVVQLADSACELYVDTSLAAWFEAWVRREADV